MTIPDSLAKAIEVHQAAYSEFARGNPEPWKAHCSHQRDVTIIGAWGGYEKGWAEQVAQRYDWAASRFKGLEGPMEFENIALVVTPELAYSVDIERGQVRLEGRGDLVPMALRSTTVYRLEDGAWKMTHRHADPLVPIQTTGSVIAK
jgi:ketosteroid isomerase-like protein